MSRHDTAVGMIDSRIDKLIASGDDISLYSETSMAIEMAYTLGAIDCLEHERYRQRLMFIQSRNTMALLEKMRRYG